MQSTVLLTAHSSIKLLPELKPVAAVQRRLRVTSGRAAAEGLQCVSAPFQVHRRLQHICILLMFHLKQDQSKHKVSPAGMHGIVQRGAESWVMARMMTVLLDLHDITSLYSVPPVKDSVTESPDDKRNQHHRCELRSCWLQQTEASLCF